MNNLPKDQSDLIVLIHGGSAAARRAAIEHLNEMGTELRVVEYATGTGEADSDNHAQDVIEFLLDYAARMASLTDKERVVLRKILDSQTNYTISMELNLTQRAIELRRASILRKLNVNSHTELVRRITQFETLNRQLAPQSTY